MNIFEKYISQNKPLPWKKKGLLFEPLSSGNGLFTHGFLACAIHIRDNEFLIAYTQRDKLSRSHIFLTRANVKDGSVVIESDSVLALTPGEPSHFDCDGALGVCFVRHSNLLYLYYIGWQNLPDSKWTCETGRCLVDPEKLKLTREFSGPVLGRNKLNPLFASATAFYVSDNLWQTWYNSCIQWEKTDNGWKHYYGIHYASSTNGVDWTCEPGMCIPFADEYEYAFGRPCVIKKDDKFYMWYAHRATKTISTYRIGFATSIDGRKWDRFDSLSGIDVSSSGWDSEMICYPYVFEHKGLFYMLYNGNGYGKTGFGLAVLESE